MTTDPWETHAAWWQANFTDGADPEYVEQIIPLLREHLGSPQRVLDVGTGEGQLAREVARAGGSVVFGIDPSRAQVDLARRRGGGVDVVQGGAAALPFAQASFDAVVACLVFEHIEAVDDAITEIGRVLAVGGRFLLFLNHPLLQAPNSGWIDDHILGEQYWRIGQYLPEDISEQEIAPGVVLPFFHRPLSRYVNALADAGLVIVRMEEPAPPPGFLARAEEYAAAAAFPRLLLLVTRRMV